MAAPLQGSKMPNLTGSTDSAMASFKAYIGAKSDEVGKSNASHSVTYRKDAMPLAKNPLNTQTRKTENHEPIHATATPSQKVPAPKMMHQCIDAINDPKISGFENEHPHKVELLAELKASIIQHNSDIEKKGLGARLEHCVKMFFAEKFPEIDKFKYEPQTALSVYEKNTKDFGEIHSQELQNKEIEILNSYGMKEEIVKNYPQSSEQVFGEQNTEVPNTEVPKTSDQIDRVAEYTAKMQKEHPDLSIIDLSKLYSTRTFEGTYKYVQGNSVFEYRGHIKNGEASGVGTLIERDITNPAEPKIVSQISGLFKYGMNIFTSKDEI